MLLRWAFHGWIIGKRTTSGLPCNGTWNSKAQAVSSGGLLTYLNDGRSDRSSCFIPPKIAICCSIPKKIPRCFWIGKFHYLSSGKWLEKNSGVFHRPQNWFPFIQNFRPKKSFGSPCLYNMEVGPPEAFHRTIYLLGCTRFEGWC